MSPEPTFWSVLAGKLAMDYAQGMVKALRGKVKRKFQGSEEKRALERSVQRALELSLAQLAEQGIVEGEANWLHLEERLRWLLQYSEVLDELSKLLDPRPDEGFELDELAATLEKEFVSEHYPRLDLATFLGDVAREFCAATVHEEALQELIKIGLLTEQLAGIHRIAAVGKARLR